jgi:hypothetical protein
VRGDPGPYMNDDGDVWVPRTVPWREARSLALTGVDYLYTNQRFRYVGKEDALLLGFVRDCLCDEQCYGGPENEHGDHDPAPECRVPAYHFQVVER